VNFGLTESNFQSIVRVLSNHSSIDKAILFGSRAKGTNKLNSDIDIVLVGDSITLTEKFKIDQEFDDLMLPYQFDTLLMHTITNLDLLEHIESVGQIIYKKSEI
jgi:predicted nucleotidyltransferase